MSNQSGRHAAVNAILGVSGGTYEGSFHAMFDADGIATGPFNARLLAWLNEYLETSHTVLASAQHAFAVSLGFASWNSLNTWEPLVSYDADAQAYFTRASIVDETYMGHINTLIAGLKSDLAVANFSDAFDCFWIFANQDDTGLAALYNVAKNDHHCTNINSVAFTAGEGFTGNGSSSYLNSDYNPSTDGAAYTQNSASAGVYVRTNSAAGNYCEIGLSSGGGVSYTPGIFARFSGDAFYGIINQGSGDAGISGGNTNSSGLFVSSRTAAAVTAGYRNGSSVFTGTGISIARINGSVFICARNDGGFVGFHSPRQIAIAFLGRGFSAGEVALINTRIEAYMDALGKGVQ